VKRRVTRNDIFDVLADELGACEELRKQFNYAFPQCNEFRFTDKDPGTSWVITRNGRLSYFGEPTAGNDLLRQAAENRLRDLAGQQRTPPSVA
jgi:hypothetical protein